MRKALPLLLPLLLLAYLLAWPVRIAPQAWDPPPAPALDRPPYLQADGLRGVERLADGQVAGPEAVVFGDDGRLYTGLLDGRVVSMRDDGSDLREIANTGGRPLGLQVEADGTLLVADARKGLLRVRTAAPVERIVDRVDGVGLGFTDDLDIDAQGRVYLSDASWKFGYGDHMSDALEHGRCGRLLMVEPAGGAAGTLLAQLSFANGVTLGPDEDYLLVNQTTEYKITRYWLKGPKAGSAETFAENLPGFPDNLSYNGRDRFWVALFAPRDPLLDRLLPHPFLRTVVARLPAFLQPRPQHQGFVLGLDLDGRVVEQYRYGGAGAYGPVTSVREHGGYLYLGSLTDTAVGRIALSALRGS